MKGFDYNKIAQALRREICPVHNERAVVNDSRDGLSYTHVCCDTFLQKLEKRAEKEMVTQMSGWGDNRSERI